MQCLIVNILWMVNVSLYYCNRCFKSTICLDGECGLFVGKCIITSCLKDLILGFDISLIDGCWASADDKCWGLGSVNPD